MDDEYRCKACDVGWARSEGRTCWSCGEPGEPMTASRAKLWRDNNEVSTPADIVAIPSPPPVEDAICENCGNDLVCEGYLFCSDCLEFICS